MTVVGKHVDSSSVAVANIEWLGRVAGSIVRMAPHMIPLGERQIENYHPISRLGASPG